MNKPLKVLFLPTSNAGITYYRFLQCFRKMSQDKQLSLAMDKFDPDRSTPYEWQFKNTSSRLTLLQMEKLISQSDMVVMGYVMTDYGVAIIQGIKTAFPDKPLLMEIDDYCHEINHYSPASAVWKPGTELTNAILEQLTLSDGVITSTDYLAKLYKEFNSKIKVIPNGVDFDIWDNLKNKRHKHLTIGWAGASTHDEDVRFIEKVVYKIIDKYPDVHFYFMGGIHETLLKRKDPRIEYFNGWHNAYKYPQEVKNRCFDIGIAPLLDNNFNRAKSNLRWLEYSALKIPTVASNVEPYKKSIIEGKTGFLCSEPEDWGRALSLLIENKELRNEIGQNAYKQVKSDFNIETISKDYASYLKGFYNEFRNDKRPYKVTHTRSKSGS